LSKRINQVKQAVLNLCTCIMHLHTMRRAPFFIW